MYIKIHNDTKIIEDHSESEFINLTEHYQFMTEFEFRPSLDDAHWKHLYGHTFEMVRKKGIIGEYSYSEMIAMMIAKQLKTRLQYAITSDGYRLWFYDGLYKYSCEIRRDTDRLDVADFETVYKTAANAPIDKLGDDGIQIFSPTLDDTRGMYPKKKTYKNIAHAGQLNIFDTLITTEQYISGGEYWIHPDHISRIHDDDYIEFSIIDKDDTLGMFSQFGLVVGTDILEIVKFVLTDYVKKGNPAEGYHSQLFEGIKGVNQVLAGLYMRVIYNSFGAQDIGVTYRIYFYE